MAFVNTCEILSLLSNCLYFRGVITLGTLRYYEEMSCLGISHMIISNQNNETKSLNCALVDMSCMVNRMCCVRFSQSPFPFLPGESRKFLLVDEGIQGFEIQNLALEIRNPSNRIRNCVTGIRNPRPES